MSPRLVHFTNGMFACRRVVSTPPLSSPLLLVAYRLQLQPLEPFDLISSVQLNDDRFSWTTTTTTTTTKKQSELCYLTLNPVYESSFFFCPKRDSTTIARRWLPISRRRTRRRRRTPNVGGQHDTTSTRQGGQKKKQATANQPYSLHSFRALAKMNA